MSDIDSTDSDEEVMAEKEVIIIDLTLDDDDEMDAIDDEQDEDEEDEDDDEEEQDDSEDDYDRPIAQRRPKRAQGLSDSGLDSAKRALERDWVNWIKAGKLDATVKFKPKGGHTCGAKITIKNGKVFKGEFKSDYFHAEMDALNALASHGGSLANIRKIEIEKQPCPRCAVALNKLGLSSKVTYGQVSKKDYPTWRFPDLGAAVNWADSMGVSAFTTKEAHQEALLLHFRSQKWWR